MGMIEVRPEQLFHTLHSNPSTQQSGGIRVAELVMRSRFRAP